MWTCRLWGALILSAAACGGSSSGGANSADDVEGEGGPGSSGGALAEGTTVCISAVLGMRYPVEEALEAHQLEPVAQCMFAEVRLEEGGEPGAYFMRYQRVGDTDWKRCESTQQDRVPFVQECTLQMIDDLGAAPTTSAAGAEAEEE
jgi:hypothetical protein